MEIQLTTQNIVFFIGIIGAIFTVYNIFRKPQEDMETKQAVSDKEIGSKATILAQKELETKALVLAEQVKNKDIENERRFNEMVVRIDGAFTIAQNHINTIEVDVKALTVSVGTMTNKITELSTIISERLPLNKNK